MAGLLDKYSTDGSYQNAVDIILVIVGLMVPFYFIGKKMKNISGTPEPLPLEKPCDKTSFILAVISGLGFCMIASVATSYFIVFLSFFGIELSSPEIAMPTGAVGIITSIIRVVVVAAVAEEIALRGHVMGNLRKYGDKFAVIVSATVFAVIHGNLIQAPFALIAGFTIGYFTIKTGTLWTGIAIHGANNLISTVFSYLFDFYGEEKIALVYTFFIYGLIVIGIIAVKAFNRRNINIGLYEDPLAISTAEKVKAFFLNPAMIIAMAYMLYITSLYVGINF
jgi:membrane protease YdiL (CAAX protease family)